MEPETLEESILNFGRTKVHTFDELEIWDQK